ncbi:MAG: hypothetical protein HMLKMBBP_02537 [Planctomycetes bacterium]|nr:hypothetical protein [Planctomycetota bacterium]
MSSDRPSPYDSRTDVYEIPRPAPAVPRFDRRRMDDPPMARSRAGDSWPEGCAPRILVVDDNAEVLGMIVAMLEEAGARTASAMQFDEAMHELASGPFDAMVTDLVMPERSGLDLVRAARLVTDLRELPAVVMCTLPRGALRDRTSAQIARLPAVEMLDKPFTSAQLGAALGRLLTSR